MKRTILRSSLALLASAAMGLIFYTPRNAEAYVEIPYTLGRVVNEATNVLTMRVEKVDKERNIIIYRKVEDIKGKWPTEVIKHNIARAGFEPREWQNVMAAVEVGKIAVFCHNGAASETCVENYWYQAYPGGDVWNMSHAEPYFLRSFAGKPEKLAGLIKTMLEGKDVVTTAMVDGNKEALKARTARIQRLRASLKIMDFDQKRDFVGWGGDEYRMLAGMPAFAQYGALSRIDPGAIGAVSADIDGDGKTDVLLYGEDKVTFYKSAGNTMEDISLPVLGGARAAVFGDYNGDGRPDLLLATPTGPRLFANLGNGSFRDDSAVLPKESYYNLTAAAMADFDGDGKQDILLANGFLGLRLYKNVGPVPVAVTVAAATPAPAGQPASAAKPAPVPPATQPFFADVSDAIGLGMSGIGSKVKGDRLLVADVNGDGRPDFLYTAGSGLLVINTTTGFVESAGSGISFVSGRITPAFGDFNGDGAVDLAVPQAGSCKLFKNDGKGKFTDVTSAAGDVARVNASAICAVFVDFDKNGKLDLMLGCVKGPNRYLKNNGNGTFTDAGDEIGFYQKQFNSHAIVVGDFNKDGAPDVVLANEGQESSILIGAKK